LEKSQIIILTGIAFSLVFTVSLQNADAATINCPSSIGGYSFYNKETYQWDSNNSINCEYQTRSNDYGNISVQWKSFVSNPNLYTGSGTWCSGNTVISDHFSSTHYLKVSFDPRESAFSNVGKSLLKQAESKNLGVSCTKQPSPTPTPSPTPSPTPDRNIDAEVAAFLLVVIIIFLIPPIIIIKKLRNRKKKKAITPSSAPADAVRIGSDTPKLFDKPKPKVKPWVDVPSPVTPMEVSEEFSKKWPKFPDEKALEKYFEKVGNCIIGAGGALHTKEKWIEKTEKYVLDQKRGTVGKYLYTFDKKAPNGFRSLKPEEFGRQLASDLVGTYSKDLLKMFPKQAVKVFGKPYHPAGILAWLVSNFGKEIATSYICMFTHLKDL